MPGPPRYWGQSGHSGRVPRAGPLQFGLHLVRHLVHLGLVVPLSEEEAERRILSFYRPYLVSTGGEPLLQQEELAPLASSLHQRGFYCEVETIGTLPPSPEMVEGVSQWNVSPKTTNSGNRRDRREAPQALDAFRELDNAYFKLVIVGPKDMEEVSLLADTYHIPEHQVALMPECVNAEVLQELGKWTAEACRARGYRFTTRLHVLLWGDQRGH